MAGRPAAGGGRWVEVDPARLGRWLAGFGERHGSFASEASDGVVRLVAADATVAELSPPPGAPAPVSLADLVDQAVAARRIGLVLARRAAVAVGIAEGQRLVAAEASTSYVQGRTAAGGWSQQRFARRRGNQARAAAQAAVDVVARLLLPDARRIAAVVGGGDRRAVDAVLGDPRLAALAGLRSDRFLAVAQPRRAVLAQAVLAARAVRIRVRDPAPTSDLGR